MRAANESYALKMNIIVIFSRSSLERFYLSLYVCLLYVVFKHAEIKVLPPLYWIPSTVLTISPTLLMLSPILMLSPHVLMLSPCMYWIPSTVLKLTPTVLMLSPTVLNNLHSTEGIPHSTEAILPHVLLLSPIASVYSNLVVISNCPYFEWLRNNFPFGTP